MIRRQNLRMCQIIEISLVVSSMHAQVREIWGLVTFSVFETIFSFFLAFEARAHAGKTGRRRNLLAWWLDWRAFNSMTCLSGGSLINDKLFKEVKPPKKRKCILKGEMQGGQKFKNFRTVRDKNQINLPKETGVTYAYSNNDFISSRWRRLSVERLETDSRPVTINRKRD